ncbi:MAG: Bacteriocin biosynthesis cyclodehydratase protein [Mycetocola sp.]|nr:Bacteriocin biosynthesis cyclodehydratase protein [Mycetocola sp.]
MISGMILRLDPRYPVVWRTTTSLQIGAEHPIARLDAVTPAVEHLLGAVMAGTSRGQLDRLAARVGARPSEVARFLADITPALTAPETSTGKPAWIVDGNGTTADGIRSLLRSSEFPEAGHTMRPGVAVLVATHVIDPRRYVRWLSLDIPHLAVVYTDIGVQIGPLVEPGAGPCLHCLARERTDADAAWPVMASQLLGQPSLAEQEPLISEVRARVARIVTARLGNGSNDLVSASLRIDGFRVSGSLTAHRPHPDCGCRSLSGNGIAPAAAGNAPSAPPMT